MTDAIRLDTSDESGYSPTMLDIDTECHVMVDGVPVPDHTPETGPYAELHLDDLPETHRGRPPGTTTGKPVVEWLRVDPALQRRATYKVAELTLAPWADAADAVQRAVVHAWRRNLRRATAESLHAWLYHRAVRDVGHGRRQRRAVGDVPATSSPERWTAAAMEAAIDAEGALDVGEAMGGARGPRLLECMQDLTTLEDAGEALGGLTRERVRQLRDVLAGRLRRWADAGPRSLGLTLTRTSRGGS